MSKNQFPLKVLVPKLRSFCTWYTLAIGGIHLDANSEKVERLESKNAREPSGTQGD